MTYSATHSPWVSGYSLIIVHCVRGTVELVVGGSQNFKMSQAISHVRLGYFYEDKELDAFSLC